MTRYASIIRLLKRLVSKRKRDYNFLEDEAEQSALLSRRPLTPLAYDTGLPRSFPEALKNGTAESKAAASILKNILSTKVSLDLDPRYWDWRFWDEECLFYFGHVFYRVCQFPPNERQAVMRDSIELFEDLEDILSRTANKLSRPILSGDGAHRDSDGVYHARKFQDKLRDLHMTRLAVVNGTVDARLRQWKNAQARPIFEEIKATSPRPGLEWEARMRKQISVLNLKTYHDNDYKPYIPPDIDEAGEPSN